MTEINDFNKAVSRGTVTVKVNNPPLAVNDNQITQKNTPITILASDLLGNDKDLDGNPLTLTGVNNGVNGTVALNSKGNVVFTPKANFAGAASFTYNVSDGNQGVSRGIVTVKVNNPPLAVNDNQITQKNTPITILASDLLGNDKDLDGNPLTLTGVNNGVNGTVALNSKGNVVFTPKANFAGAASFTYNVSDGNQGVSKGTVTVKVNNPPLAVNDNQITQKNTPITILASDLLGNDKDADGNPLTLTGVNNGVNGTVALNSKGNVVFTPNDNFAGAASFTYTISDGNQGVSQGIVTVKVNNPPLAVNDNQITQKNTPITILASDLLGNDEDLDGNPLTLTGVNNGVNGTVALNSKGDVVFTPKANFAGAASFTYNVSDGNQGVSKGTVTVKVNNPPLAVNDNQITQKNTPITILASDLLGNDKDADGNPLTLTGVNNGVNGTVALNSKGNVVFTPNDNFAGAASFTYTISDGNQGVSRGIVTVKVNNPPLAVNDNQITQKNTPITILASDLLGNDEDLDGNPLTLTGVNNGVNGTVALNSKGNVVFTPNDNFAGAASFTYTISDGNQGVSQGIVTVKVNNPPLAVNDNQITQKNTPITILASDLLGNDKDADGNPLTLTGVNNGVNGTVALNSKGDVVFTPKANFAGAASFTYNVSDGNQGVSRGIVTVKVNNPPLAVNDNQITQKNTPITILASDLLGNDKDADGNPLTLTGVNNGVNGTVALNSKGNVVFTPNDNFAGAASFTYNVSDGNQGVSRGIVTVKVNNPPLAVNDNQITQKNTPITILASDLLGNDEDLDGNPLTLTGVNNGVNGTVALNSKGNVVFTPNDNFAGAASFTYTISDGNQGVSQGIVTVKVNNPPLAVNDNQITQKNTPITILASDLLGNDKDADGNPLTLTGVNNGVNGTVALNSKGDVVFTPKANFAGAASFTYNVSDGNQGVSKGTVTVKVNNPPLAVNDNQITQKNTPITILASDLLGNDEDLDGNPLTLTGVNNGVNGTVALNSKGDVVFTPNANFSGVASFTYTISDGNQGVSQGIVTVKIDNIIDNGTFTTANGVNIFNTNSSIIYSKDADKGWFTNASDSQWNFDATNQWVKTDNSGTLGLIEVIKTNQVTKGLQPISFDATNWGSGNTLRLQVYGVDGEFKMSSGNTNAPVSQDASPIKVVSLLDTNNIANTQFDWKTFTWDSINFGSGYQYIALRFSTNGVDETEFQAIDNVMVGSLPKNPRTPPQAYDDKFLTQQNKTLTILAKDVLANDTNPNGGNLYIKGVDQATYGNVSLDSQGNILFTPKTDFSGVTSFDYTIQNDQGVLSKATVTVNVAHPVALGTNLAGISSWSTQLPFVDSFKSSRGWITQFTGIFNTEESNLLDLDQNGWVRSLPALEDAPKYTSVCTLFNPTNYSSGGRYVVLYEGEGEIQYGLGAKIDRDASIAGRDVINVDPNEGISLSIIATDPNHTGNYIRNIQVVPEAYQSTYQTQIFNPDFLQKTQPFGAVRFMDWMETNNSSQGEWSDRPTPDDSTWTTKGAPVEIMVQLANTLDVDPWFNMPIQATDEYVRNFATYVRDNLEPERKVYVEYSNEVWNGNFTQLGWVIQQAENDPNFHGNAMNWFGKRTTEITRIWDQVFDQTGKKEQVIGVMAAQAANIGTATSALNYASWSDENKSHADYGIDAIAIAPYFGGYIGKAENETQVQTWNVDQLFDELTQGGVLNNGPVGGAIKRAYNNIDKYAALAQKENLQLLAYEGGQHLVADEEVQNRQALTDLFIQANRDPRMGELYKQYLTYWYQQGGGLFMNFNDVGTPSKYGSWGTLENLNQTSSPKYDALMDVLKSSGQ
ncbi:beta strand repeat-containing protein [Aphanothece sacrum]|uniref:Cellulose-binding domain protein n=1 Tax=Aphanothece sacrum FPU1 TaxID=1920663 RepID=A0A401IJZ5_APHSA|nr:cadherin-like domain-containing protein [Aphanothece sacrum]GBF81431.1 cellulose-binding domain protein [Aphanothece sacrum FPU1]GBF85562.1 cellulose-binding domain protein [Aphanothece sacrum FPU3]